MSDKQKIDSMNFTKKYPPRAAWYNSDMVYKDLAVVFEIANNRLVKKDIHLFQYKASERSICGALMLRINSALRGTPFNKYHVDVEYNRNRDGAIKTIIDKNEVITNITCDLIVHSRGECKGQDNLIALEMKKANRTDAEKTKDRNRLIALTKESDHAWCYDNVTSPEHVCRYILGIYYEINQNYNQITLEFYRQGIVTDTRIINI